MDPTLNLDIPDYDAAIAQTEELGATPLPRGEVPSYVPPAPQPSVTAPVEEVIGDAPDYDIAYKQMYPEAKETLSTTLTKEDVINDTERLDKIRKMMSTTKDVYYQTAPAEEVMTDFLAHMRFVSTNEISTAMEAINVASADDDTLAIYGGAYQVYDEMGSMFENGDAWNGTIDYAQAFITSPSLYLGLGIGKIAGQVGTKTAAKGLTTLAINAAAKKIATKSGGKVAETLVKQQLKNSASKITARYAIAGAMAIEAPIQVFADHLYQDTRMKVGVQDEFSYLESAAALLGGVAGGVVPATVLVRSSKSTLANAGTLLSNAAAKRSSQAAKRVAPAIKDALEKKQVEWLKLAEAGKAFDNNLVLQKSVAKWFFDHTDESSLVSILQKEGANLTRGEGEFTKTIIGYATNLGDEALEGFNEALQPLGITFGEATELMANFMRDRGQDFNLVSQASRFYDDLEHVSVAKRNAKEAVVKGAGKAGDADVTERDMAGYALSIWKKTLVSTFPTTALNVKGWAVARASTAVSDMLLAGGILGRAGIRAVIDPAGATADLMKVKALAQNQVFALNTLVDPFLSAEGFLSLLERAPKKVKKSLTGQIFGGVDDFSPSRFGLNPDSKAIKTIESLSTNAQKVSLVHLQDTLTKGITGLTALDRETRLAFNKGITQIIEDGEAWKLTDVMWEKAMKGVLRETFSEDLSKGGGLLAGFAKAIQHVSQHPIGGYVVPFGKFINNTMAFTYRHSPLAIVSVAGKVFKSGAKKGAEDSIGEIASRSAVGTMALAYLMKNEASKQEEGLQWFEHRKADGSVENVANLFPYSVYALLGRIGMGMKEGEGINIELFDELKKQVGPLETLDNLVNPAWLKDSIRYLSDDQIDSEEKGIFLKIVAHAGDTIGGIAAGYTRPLDLPSRMLSLGNEEAGGGYIPDKKQAEGMDKTILSLTRYVTGFFNLAFGEENELGVTMYGTPKESSLQEGPVQYPNPAGTFTGTTIQPPAKFINKLLGSVDKPPFKAESFTSGNPEFDAYVNKEITPLLEQRAKAMFQNPAFAKAPQSQKVKLVDQLITTARSDLLSLLEGQRIGDPEERLLNERRKLLTKDRSARRRAMKSLGITTPEHKLSLFEMAAIKRRMEYEGDEADRTFGQ